MYDKDDWMRSSRSAATIANCSQVGSGVPPENNPSSSTRGNQPKMCENNFDCKVNMRTYLNIPIDQQKCSRLHLLLMRRLCFLCRLSSSKVPVKEMKLSETRQGGCLHFRAFYARRSSTILAGFGYVVSFVAVIGYFRPAPANFR